MPEPRRAEETTAPRKLDQHDDGSLQGRPEREPSRTSLQLAPGLPSGAPPPEAPSPDAREKRVRIARALALVADAVEIAFIPAFAGGVLSPLNDVIDVAVGILMTYLVGWHVAFLPTFIAEMVPGLGLFPTWTAAVWFATRGRGAGRK